MNMAKDIKFGDYFKGVCDKFKKLGCVEQISTDFSKLTTDKDRFIFVKNLASEHDIRPQILLEEVPGKDSAESVKLRNEGNDAFVKGNEMEALKFYNSSALHATRDEELSLAYANRSAVSFSSGYFQDSLLDIDRALSLNYPIDLKYKLMKRKGECLCKLGKHDDARERFESSMEYVRSSNLNEVKQKEVEEGLLTLWNECLQNHDEPLNISNEIETTPTVDVCKYDDVFTNSDCIRLEYSNDLGRHVVATRNILAGDIILTEDPFASILLPENYLTHCYHCLKRCNSLIPCSSCCHVMYCSELCRRNSWNKYHEKECAVLYYLMKLDMGKLALLAVRIVMSLEMSYLQLYYTDIFLNPYTGCQKEKGFSQDGKYMSSDYTAIYHLEGHSDKRYVSDLFKRACMSYCIVECLKASPSLFSMQKTSEIDKLEELVGELILRHLQNLPCNAHEVSELQVSKLKENKDQCGNYEHSFTSNLIEIGAAAYAVLSLLNHSCDPNVVRHNHNGKTAVLRAIRPLKKGEQIVDNYGYHYAVHSLHIRHDNLKDQYFFDCNCIACLQQWPLYQLLEEKEYDESWLCQACENGPLKRVDKISAENRIQLDSTSNSNELFVCKSCGNTVDVAPLKDQIVNSSMEFKQNMTKVLSGEKIDLSLLVNHLTLLDKSIVRPWKEYNECQEIMKHIINLEGNCFHV